MKFEQYLIEAESEELKKELKYQNVKDDVQSLSDEIKSKYDVKLSLIGRGDKIEIVKIIVPEDERNNGVGTNVMNHIAAFADKKGYILTLTPTSDFGGNKRTLVDFYKRFGFIENKGSNKDYEINDTMYRVKNEIWTISNWIWNIWFKKEDN